MLMQNHLNIEELESQLLLLIDDINSKVGFNLS